MKRSLGDCLNSSRSQSSTRTQAVYFITSDHLFGPASITRDHDHDKLMYYKAYDTATQPTIIPYLHRSSSSNVMSQLLKMSIIPRPQCSPSLAGAQAGLFYKRAVPLQTTTVVSFAVFSVHIMLGTRKHGEGEQENSALSISEPLESCSYFFMSLVVDSLRNMLLMMTIMHGTQ